MKKLWPSEVDTEIIRKRDSPIYKMRHVLTHMVDVLVSLYDYKRFGTLPNFFI